MNVSEILADEYTLAILIRDAMSEFRSRRLGPVSSSQDQNAVRQRARDYAADRYGPYDPLASERRKQLREKQVDEKADQVVARCDAAKRLYDLSEELAALIAEVQRQTLEQIATMQAIEATKGADLSLSVEDQEARKRSEDRWLAMNLSRKVRIRKLDIDADAAFIALNDSWHGLRMRLRAGEDCEGEAIEFIARLRGAARRNPCDGNQ